MEIPFNKPLVLGNELEYIQEALERHKLAGNGPFTQKCHEWFEKNLACNKAFLTTSCTHALEMAAILADIGPGDEVIMPSFTFVSTANAFVLRGAKIVFIDVRPETMNMNENLIESAITEKTKVIVPVHYAGVSCEMDTIMNIAEKYNLLVIEDAAQAVWAKYKGSYLGTIGHLACFSFHETKNFSCGEGGALIANSEVFASRADIIREKGTNRSAFYRGEVDKYTWIDIGSSYLPGELNAAYLLAQLEAAPAIIENRMKTWDRYYNNLKPLEDKGLLSLPKIPDNCTHNAHIFYIRVKTHDLRTRLLEFMKTQGVGAIFHYVPLHTAPAGVKFSRFSGKDIYTTNESLKLIRLPLYYGMGNKEIDYITNLVDVFYAEQCY